MIKKLSVYECVKTETPDTQKSSSLEFWPAKTERSWRERLSRNLAVSTMLLLAILAVRDAELPSGETVLTAVQQIVDQNWDDGLGKISFVSNLFPESVAVFFESAPESEELIMPCLGVLSHTWDKNEPYIGYKTTENTKVYAMASGQIMSISHGNNEETILRVRQDDGLETFYYLTDAVSLKEGDRITNNTCLAKLTTASQILIEVRKNGLPIDPTNMIRIRNEGGL